MRPLWHDRLQNRGYMNKDLRFYVKSPHPLIFSLLASLPSPVKMSSEWQYSFQGVDFWDV